MIDRSPKVTVCFVGGALILATLANVNLAGLRFNSTASMPRGLWRVAERATPLQRGEIVTVCPPNTTAIRQGEERGYVPAGDCPGGYEPLVKPIAATAGDVVVVSSVGVKVNGQRVQGTAQLTRDSSGRPLRPFPAGTYSVALDEVWLLSGHDPRSFDSRYFGPVPAKNVQGVAQPVWVVR